MGLEDLIEKNNGLTLNFNHLNIIITINNNV